MSNKTLLAVSQLGMQLISKQTFAVCSYTKGSLEIYSTNCLLNQVCARANSPAVICNHMRQSSTLGYDIEN